MEENEGEIPTGMTLEEAAAPIGAIANEMRGFSKLIGVVAIELRRIRYLLELEVLDSEDKKKDYARKLSGPKSK